MPASPWVRYTDNSLWQQVAIGQSRPTHEAFDIFGGTVQADGTPVEVWLLRPAALGTLTPDAVLGFLENAEPSRSDAALNPIAYGIQSGRIFAVYRAGPPPLSALLKDDTALNAPQAVAMVSAAVDALGDAPHPGLTSRNVLVGDGTDVRVTGFGFPALEPATVLPGTTGLPASAFTAAPEQEPGTVATPTAQVYAAAALLFWLLSGRPPFRADSTEELRTLHKHAVPPLLAASHPELPPALSDAIDRALSKAPEERFPDLDSFQTAINASLVFGAGSPLRTQPLRLDMQTTRVDASLVAQLEETNVFATPIAGEPEHKRRSVVGFVVVGLLILPLIGLFVAALMVARDTVPALLQAVSTQPTRTSLFPTATPRVSVTPVSSPTPGGSPSPSPTTAPMPTPGSSGPTAEYLSTASQCWDKDWPCAITNLEQANAIDPADTQIIGWLTQSYVNYGAQLAREESPDSGLVWFEKALAKTPDDPKATSEKALANAALTAAAAYNEQEWAYAAEQAEFVLAGDPAYPRMVALAYSANVNEGKRLAAMGDRDGAARACNRALVWNSNGPEARDCIATVATPTPTPNASQTPAPTSTPTAGPTRPPATATPRPAAPTNTAAPARACFSPAVSRQNSNNGYMQVRGQVLDSDGRGIAGVRVEVDSGGTLIPVTTDGSGGYSVDSLTRAKYTVRIVPPRGTAQSVIVDGSDPSGDPARFIVNFREGTCV